MTWLYGGGLALLVGAAVNARPSDHGSSRPDRAGRRRFGRQVTDADSFETRLDELVGQASAADVPVEELRRALRQRAETTRDQRGTSVAEDEPHPEWPSPSAVASAYYPVHTA